MTVRAEELEGLFKDLNKKVFGGGLNISDYMGVDGSYGIDLIRYEAKNFVSVEIDASFYFCDDLDEEDTTLDNVVGWFERDFELVIENLTVEDCVEESTLNELGKDVAMKYFYADIDDLAKLLRKLNSYKV